MFLLSTDTCPLKYSRSIYEANCTSTSPTDLSGCISTQYYCRKSILECNSTNECITIGESPERICTFYLRSISLKNEMLDCYFCQCDNGTMTRLWSCNYYSQTAAILSGNNHSCTVRKTSTTATITMIMSTTVPTNNTTTPVSILVLPVVAGVLVPVCLLCTISVAAATLCIILHYRKHQTPQQSGTTQYVLYYYYYTSVLYYHTTVLYRP